MKVKVVGWRNVSFKANDGNEVSGRTIYYVNLDPMDLRYGAGHSVDKFFISDSKLGRSDNLLEISHSYEVFYNRYGKIDSWKEVQG